MPQCSPRLRSVHWLAGPLIGLAGCLSPIPPQQAQPGSTGSDTTQATTSAQESSTSQDSESSSSQDPSTSSSQDSDSDTEASEKEVVPRNQLRRLTATQVRNALTTVFDPQDKTAFEAAMSLSDLYNNDAFSNDLRYQVVSPEALARIQTTAQGVGTYVAKLQDARQLSGCKSSDSDQVCIQGVIRNIGEKLFRRPLARAELDAYQELHKSLAAKESQVDALAGLLQALVASPHFHYIPPTSRPDQHAYLVATRLALFLWNDLPDQALTQSAQDQTLLKPKELRAQAKRMLRSPKAAAVIENFYLQMLRLGAIEVRSHGQAPADLLAKSFGEHISRVYQKGTLDALWTLPVTLSEPALAEHFPGQYPGLLAHPVFNWIHAKPTYSDPIARGAVIREEVFCNALRAPPPDVQMLLPAPKPDATTRERFEIHRKDPSCASCHSLIDPLGFGLEAYDHLGRFRAKENNKAIDDSGALVATDVNGGFQGVAELSKKLAQSIDVRNCLAEQWLTYAEGRPLKGSDQTHLEALFETLAREDNALDELILDIATSETITYQEPTQ